MNILLDAVRCRLNHIRALDIQLIAVGKESIRIEFCDLHDALVLTLCTLEHFVLARIRV